MFTGGSVFSPFCFGRFRMRPRSLVLPDWRTFAGLSRATNSLAPERFCEAYVLPGASFTQNPSPVGGAYGLPRVLSKPSARDQAAIASPIWRPRLSERIARLLGTP